MSARKILVLLSTFLILLSAAASATTIHFDAINYIASFNAGGDGIRAVNGALTGLDYPGDWVRYILRPTEFGSYGVTVRNWGLTGYPYVINLIVEDNEQNAQVIEISFVGKGACGA